MIVENKINRHLNYIFKFPLLEIMNAASTNIEALFQKKWKLLWKEAMDIIYATPTCVLIIINNRKIESSL